MKCPHCDQTPISCTRYLISRWDVGFYSAMNGFLKCQECKSILRATSKTSIYPPYLLVIVIFVLSFTLPKLIVDAYSEFGKITMSFILFFLMLIFFIVLHYFRWRHLEYQKVEPNLPPEKWSKDKLVYCDYGMLPLNLLRRLRRCSY